MQDACGRGQTLALNQWGAVGHRTITFTQFSVIFTTLNDDILVQRPLMKNLKKETAIILPKLGYLANKKKLSKNPLRIDLRFSSK